MAAAARTSSCQHQRGSLSDLISVKNPNSTYKCYSEANPWAAGI